MRRPYDALLLDLDGTLLGVEPSFFLGPLVEAMSRHFPSLPRDRFREALFAGTGEIMEAPRRGGETNLGGFFRVFSAASGMGEAEAEEGFAAFYRESFPALSVHTAPIPGARELVEAAAGEGYRLALATNPIFPRAATLERLSWTGIPARHFHLIPFMEETAACKPQREYFLAVAEGLGVAPERCLMVGNDAEQDLPASLLGMETFFVDLFPIRRGKWKGAPSASGDLRALSARLGIPPRSPIR